MDFKKYVEAADIAESWFGRKLLGKTPQQAATQAKIDKIPDELDLVHRDQDLRKKFDKDDRKAADKMNRRLEPGNLYQALNFYNDIISASGYRYPPDMITRISQSERVNEIWDNEYREMFLKMRSTPAMAKMLLDKAFKDMGLPPVQKIKPQFEVVPEPDPIPEFSEIVDFIKNLLVAEETFTKEDIKKRVKDRWPALNKPKADSRIGRALNKATKSMIKIHQPEPEPKQPRRRNIFKFPGADS